MQYYWFQLWREWKLSIAELLAVFPESEILFSGNSILILGNISKENVEKNFYKLWWSIKAFECNFFGNIEEIYEKILEIWKLEEWKFKYSINLFGEKNISLTSILKKTKNLLKNKNISARYFNKDDGKNLSSAQIIWNSILKKGFDFNIVNIWDVFYFWKTFEIQDINAYSKRDFSKNRDMQIGMLPPKLCQIMINIWINPPLIPLKKGENWSETKVGGLYIYDPFVWLGTVLIEALNMWIKNVFGSDLNEKMVEESAKNLKYFIEKNNLQNTKYKTEKLNAKFINESSILKENKIDLIVSEWYLWEIMTKKNISLERIKKQKESLILIHKAFFENLSKINFDWKIVICFPFWELNWKYIYFSEVLEVLEKYCKIEKMFENPDFDLSSKTWSLLYKREKQLVWREIYKLSIKKL